MARRRGFTLIELLLVIAIIGILVALTLTVGASAISGGRSRQTADTIRVVDSAIESYTAEVGQNPPAFVVTFAPGEIQDPLVATDFAAYPLADAVDVSGGDANRTVINSMGLFIKAAEDAGLGDLFSAINPALLVRWDGDADFVEPTAAVSPQHQPELRTILDAWGKPLRFVHPAWDGIVTKQDNNGNLRKAHKFGGAVAPIGGPRMAFSNDYWLPANRAPSGFDPDSNIDFPIRLIRRDYLTDQDRAEWEMSDVSPIGDGDGGYAEGGRPYVYSAGRDGDPSKRGDNVYTVQPRFAVEWTQ